LATTYTINPAAIYYKTGGTSGTLLTGIHYGDVPAAYSYMTMSMYDFTQFLRLNVTNVILRVNRQSLTTDPMAITPPTPRAAYGIQPFVSNNINLPMFLNPTIDYNKYITGFPGLMVSITADYLQSGILDTDVTSIIKMSNVFGGYMGMSFAGSYTLVGNAYATDSSHQLIITADPLLPLAPTNIQPTMTMNPKGNIRTTWSHAPNPNLLAPDPQVASQVQIVQGGITLKDFVISDTINTYVIPANTMTAYTQVTIRVRTQTQYNGWGPWGQGTFNLATNPPLAPTPMFPVGISVIGSAGVNLEFLYSSMYDATPSAFDGQYRIDGGAWKSISNTTGALVLTTGVIDGQHTVDWQVRAYGALGDVGPWSSIVTFYTIGAPPPPIITAVSNSNRPTIFFSGSGVLSYDLAISNFLYGVYVKNNIPYVAGQHTITELIPNGDYMVNIRIANQYGLKSTWTTFYFTISVQQPPPLTLQVSRAIAFCNRLYFDNLASNNVYVYRSLADANKFKRIAKTVDVNYYDDYTAAPDERYVYYVRVVTANFAFADSNQVAGYTDFPYTTIATVTDRSNMLKLLRQVDNEPQRERKQQMERDFTNFIGRKYPVIQVGESVNELLSFSFYVTKQERNILRAYNELNNTLVVRDRKFGTIFGQIASGLSDKPDMDGWVVSFDIQRSDYSEEVEL